CIVVSPNKILFLFFLIFLISSGLHAQIRGGDVEAVVGQDVTVGKQWAVFIAIDRYGEWGPLDDPVKDARELQRILRENYIIDNWRELLDEKASAEGIRSLFAELRGQVGKDDSVFVFHAGHGFKDEATETGAWIPADAGRSPMRKEGWISHDEIRRYLDRLPARHVFLISDSCYSGDLLMMAREGTAPQFDSVYYRKAYASMSRQILSSGASETVPDSSEFARRLKNALSRAEGACIDPLKLFEQVREVQGSQPRYGVMPQSLHQADGSFLFFRKQTAGAAVTAPVIQPAPHQIPTANTAQSYFDQGKIFFDRKDYETAIIAFTEAVELDPDFAEAYAFRARSYDGLDNDKALADAELAIQLNPRLAFPYYTRGRLSWREPDKARADFTRAIQNDPGFAMAYNQRGETYYDEGRYRQAIDDYTRAIQIDPNYTQAYNNRGSAYQRWGDYDQAIADYNKIIQINLKSEYDSSFISYDYVYKKLIHLNLLKGDYDRVIADYTALTQIYHNDASSYYGRGDVYRKKGDYDRAIADYITAIQIDPNREQYYHSRGDAYREKGDYNQAIVDYTTAIQKYSSNDSVAEVYYKRGLAWQAKGDGSRADADFNRAIIDYTTAIQRDSNLSSIFSATGTVYYKRGLVWQAKGDGSKANADFDQAIADFDSLIVGYTYSNTDHWIIWYEAGKTYYHRGLAWQAKGDESKANADFAEAKRLGYAP
ncbi:MAG: tetratricopeptide repeat protein, partial [Treponema sp.]|nr:tetratricopeptide repeat protein [Treponema sp.]